MHTLSQALILMVQLCTYYHSHYQIFCDKHFSVILYHTYELCGSQEVAVLNNILILYQILHILIIITSVMTSINLLLK